MQSSCGAVVVALSWSSDEYGTPAGYCACELCVHIEGVLVSMWSIRWQVYRFECSWGVRVSIQSLQARKPLDRMCVHARDGQTYLSEVDSMS